MTGMPKRLPVDFLPTVRTYMDRETGAESCLITDLALSRAKVTLNHTYKGHVDDILQRKTLFNEITIAAPVIPESIQELMKFGEPLANNDVPSIAKAISSVIERRWDPKQFHLISHSSGYDSRIVSRTIANLRDKHGESWLGEVLFLCWEPEGAVFKKIMEFEGWKKKQYHICNEGAEASEYYARVLNFDDCWRLTNDAQPPIYISTLAIKQLRESELITKPLSETQFLAGGLGNECFMYRPDRLIRMFYYSRWAGSCVIPYSERILPFASYDVLRLIKPVVKFNLEVKYSELIARNNIYSGMLRCIKPAARWVRQEQLKAFGLLRFSKPEVTQRPYIVQRNMRTGILNYLSPELLMIQSEVIDGPDAPQRQLSERLRRRCAEDFAASWYYNNIIIPHFPEYNLNVPRNIWIDDWWSVYAKASICEYLVKNGVEIIV